MMRVRSFIAIIGLSLFTIGCPQSKESLDAYAQLRGIGKIIVTDAENPAFAENVYARMISYLNLRNVSGINQGLGVQSGKTSTLECLIVHHSRDTADMECFLKYETNPLVQARAFRGVGMNEYGTGMYDNTPEHILARRAIDELHATIEKKLVARQKGLKTKTTP